MKLKKKVKNALLIILALLGLLLVSLGFIYQQGLGAVSDDTTVQTFVVASGSTATEIGHELENEKLIKSSLIFKVYLKLEGKGHFKAGEYQLSPSMNVKEIVNVLEGGSGIQGVRLTFQEGYNLKQYGAVIEKNTNHKQSEFLELMEDRDYVRTLMKDYWFLSDDILDDDIYYPLEGYLYPDTYDVASYDTPLDTLVRKMLNKMKSVLDTYKSEIDKSNFTIHEFLTLASMVELEGASDDSRAGVAGVFINRLEDNWSLGSDVTACYAFHVDIKDCNDNVPYSKYNPYNTRSSSMRGKLPIGPICNPSVASIKGSIEYDKSDYFYFVADINKKVYFTRNETEHQAVIAEIKKRGEWPW